MSGLSSSDLIEAIKDDRIVFDPFTPDAIQPASIDLKLGKQILRRRRGFLNKLAPRMFPLPPVEIIVEPSGRWYRIQRPEHYEHFSIPTFEEHQDTLQAFGGLDIKRPRPFILYPGDFCLGFIEQKVGPKSKQYTGQFQDKSSFARLGCTGHGGSGWVDPGNVGNWTTELHNKGHEPIKLFAGMNILQICFDELKSPALEAYSGKYQNPDWVEGAK